MHDQYMICRHVTLIRIGERKVGREWGENQIYSEEKKGLPVIINHVSPCYYLVPGEEIESSYSQAVRDFKSLASTSSATQARLELLEFEEQLYGKLSTVIRF